VDVWCSMRAVDETCGMSGAGQGHSSQLRRRRPRDGTDDVGGKSTLLRISVVRLASGGGGGRGAGGEEATGDGRRAGRHVPLASSSVHHRITPRTGLG